MPPDPAATPDPTITPPPTGATPEAPLAEAPHVHFSTTRWLFTGIMRVMYRLWTRIAAHLFPENSWAARLALALHIPLPDQLNMSWITDHLAVGGRIRPQDIKALAGVGITHDVDTRAEHRDDAQALAKEHIELLYLPTPDTRPFTIEQMMQGAQWVQQRMEQGGRVLIHCEHGVGRSALLACAVLVYACLHASAGMQLRCLNHRKHASMDIQVVRL